MILDIEVNEGYRVGYGREDKHRGIDIDVSETDGPEECRALGGKRQGLHSMYCNDYSKDKNKCSSLAVLLHSLSI